MNFEKIVEVISAFLQAFGPPIFLLIVGIVGWPFIVTIGLIGGACAAVVAGVAFLCVSIADLF